MASLSLRIFVKGFGGHCDAASLWADRWESQLGSWLGSCGQLYWGSSGRAESGWSLALSPELSLIAGPLMDYLPTWQKIYFYSWG